MKVMPFKAECAERYLRRLPDFTEYRLPEIDEAGIDLQVLSLTVPGMQVNIPTGSAPSPRCRCRTPRPRRPSGSVPLPNSDSAGRCSTTACSGRAGAISTHPNTLRCGRHWNPLGCRYICTPAPRRPSNGRSCEDVQNCRGVVELGRPSRRARTAHRLQRHVRQAPGRDNDFGAHG